MHEREQKGTTLGIVQRGGENGRHTNDMSYEQFEFGAEQIEHTHSV